LNETIIDDNLNDFKKLVKENKIALYIFEDARKYTILHKVCIHNAKKIQNFTFNRIKAEINLIKNMKNLEKNIEEKSPQKILLLSD